MYPEDSRRRAVGWGLVSGLGAATADGFYGAVAAFGLTFISGILTAQQQWFRLIGGLFLLYLGIWTLLAKPPDKMVADKKVSLLGNYLSTFLLTITNPLTILSFAAIFAGLGLGSTGGNMAAAVLMVIGVVSGSALWWVVLSGMVGFFRARFNPGVLKPVNWISGLIIISFAVLALVSLFQGMD
ncbi:MAG: LysE family transporter [Dehalococcoidales bacterium]|nr:LysE family transporter [Dehalococcoidales bacterium]